MLSRRRAARFLGLSALFLGVSFIATAHLLWQFGRPASHVRLAAENYPLIRVGMSQAEVEGLLGGPPGNYGRYAGGQSEMTAEGYWPPPGSVERIWCDDGNRFEICFDAGGRVVGHHRRAGYSQTPGEGPLVRLWRSLRVRLGL
jgi:hypothetical protein